MGVNADALKLVGESLSSDALGFIYPLGSDLVEPVNMALAEMKANGMLEELAQKFFTDAFTITYDDLAGEEEEAGLPDLEGREVTVAIENQYLPLQLY